MFFLIVFVFIFKARVYSMKDQGPFLFNGNKACVSTSNVSLTINTVLAPPLAAPSPCFLLGEY